MSLTIQQILSDAKKLTNKLKEDDSAADALLSQIQSAYKQIDAMKQVSVTSSNVFFHCCIIICMELNVLYQ